jgi:hypothetical protein
LFDWKNSWRGGGDAANSPAIMPAHSIRRDFLINIEECGMDYRACHCKGDLTDW